MCLLRVRRQWSLVVAHLAAQACELWGVGRRLAVVVFSAVQAVRLAGAVAEMNHRRVSEDLAARSASLLVRFVLTVPIAVVVAYLNASAAIGASRVFAHVVPFRVS